MGLVSTFGHRNPPPSLVIRSFGDVKGSLRMEKVEEWYERRGPVTQAGACSKCAEVAIGTEQHQASTMGR